MGVAGGARRGDRRRHPRAHRAGPRLADAAGLHADRVAGVRRPGPRPRPIAPPRAAGGGPRRSRPAAVRAGPAAGALPARVAGSLANGAGAGRSREMDRLRGGRRSVPVDRAPAPGRAAPMGRRTPDRRAHRGGMAGDRGCSGAGRLTPHSHRALSVGRRAALSGDRAEPVARRRPEDREQPHPRRLPGVLQPPGSGAALPAPRRRRGDLLGPSDRHAGAGGARLCSGWLRRHGRLLHSARRDGGGGRLALGPQPHRGAGAGDAGVGGDRVLRALSHQYLHDLPGSAGGAGHGVGRGPGHPRATRHAAAGTAGRWACWRRRYRG